MANLITDANIDSFDTLVLQSELPVLVDFWAPWCGPCRNLAPILKLVAEDLKGKVAVVKVNVDMTLPTNTLAARYDVKGLPTLAIFKDGEVVVQRVGFMSRDQILQWIEEALGLEETAQ